MTDEQIRVAVAEACGLKNIAKHVVCEGTGMDFEEWYSGIPDKGGFAIPDYPNDLNACHEMEVMMSDTQHQKFRNILAGVCGFNYAQPSESSIGHHRDYVSATARQRCEAFLCTLGKWTEEPATQTK